MRDGSPSSPVAYLLGGQSLSGPDRILAAEMLAEDAMKIRCGHGAIFESWKRRRDGGPAHSDVSGRALATYARIGFGLPTAPSNADHLQGLVAELFWNRLILENALTPDGRELIKAHSAKPDPLEPGGDGLAIYLQPDGVLAFRLWEIKKHHAKKMSAATIKRASQQLFSRGQEYLAKLAGPESMSEPGARGELYSEMVELWISRSPRSGAGVSIGTSDTHAPKSAKAFGSLPKAFPEFSTAGQLEAFVVAIPAFPDFAAEVREIVWKGL